MSGSAKKRQVKKPHSLLGQLVVDAQVLVDIPWLIVSLQPDQESAGLRFDGLGFRAVGFRI